MQQVAAHQSVHVAGGHPQGGHRLGLLLLLSAQQGGDVKREGLWLRLRLLLLLRGQGLLLLRLLPPAKVDFQQGALAAWARWER